MVKVGNKAPEFTGVTDTGEKIKLKDLRGKTVVLYFYPKDNTPAVRPSLATSATRMRRSRRRRPSSSA